MSGSAHTVVSVVFYHHSTQLSFNRRKAEQEGLHSSPVAASTTSFLPLHVEDILFEFKTIH